MHLVNQLYCTCLLLLCSLLTLPAQAQFSTSDTSLALDNAIRQYHTYLDPEPALYRGSQYVIYAFQIKEGHPYFDTDQMQTGSVLYNGILYKDIPLIYDLAMGLLVTNDYYKIYRIALINEEIDSFTIQNHIFIRFRDSLDPSAPRPGFYELLHNGRTVILKKEKKTVREEVSTSVITKYIEYSVSYYVKKDSIWYLVNTKKGLLNAFRDKGPQLKKFLRSNGLKFRQDKDNTLIKAVTWYDSLHP